MPGVGEEAVGDVDRCAGKAGERAADGEAGARQAIAVGQIFLRGRRRFDAAFKRAKAEARAWEGAYGLEWTVPSPAPHHTFTTPPVIRPGDLAHGDITH